MKSWIMYCVLVCVFLSLGLFLFFQKQPGIAVIDLDRVVLVLSRSLAAQYPKGDVPKRVLVDLLENIRGDMELFAQKRNVYLLAKQACFSKADDLTDAFLQEMSYEGD